MLRHNAAKKTTNDEAFSEGAHAAQEKTFLLRADAATYNHDLQRD